MNVDRGQPMLTHFQDPEVAVNNNPIRIDIGWQQGFCVETADVAGVEVVAGQRVIETRVLVPDIVLIAHQILVLCAVRHLCMMAEITVAR